MNPGDIQSGEFYIIKTHITGNIISRVFIVEGNYYISAAHFRVFPEEIFPLKK